MAKAVLKGWRCPRTNLWRIPLVPIVTNVNTDTLILDHPSGQNSLNSMYTVESNQISRDHVALQMCKNYCQEYLHNVYELPSVEPTIRYLHGAAGFPTKTFWLKAICKGNYLSWPIINVKNVAKYFPETTAQLEKRFLQPTRSKCMCLSVCDSVCKGQERDV